MNLKFSILALAFSLVWVANGGDVPVQSKAPAQTPAKKSMVACPRTQSKLVREYFVRVLLPLYQQYSVPVPEKCPFSPLYDIYHYHENNKTKLDSTKWKCEICGKTFVDEKYLDKHFDSRHNESLQRGPHSVCLANFCKIFRCDFLMNPGLVSKKCYESVMANLRNKCKSYIELCIPKSSTPAIQAKLTADLRENLCGYLKCSRYNEFPAYMTKGPSFFIIFGVVFCIGLCIIAYGVINHTDIIYDENEDMTLPQNANKPLGAEPVVQGPPDKECVSCPHHRVRFKGDAAKAKEASSSLLDESGHECSMTKPVVSNKKDD